MGLLVRQQPKTRFRENLEETGMNIPQHVAIILDGNGRCCS